MTSFDFSEIIAWTTVILLVAAIPLTILYFRYLNTQKSDSQLSKFKTKNKVKPKPIPNDSPPAEVNYNFDNNWSSSSDTDNYAVDVDTGKKLAKIILKTIALNGESGMLIKQISDMLELHEIEVNYPLNYLANKGFIESVISQKGNIYYLTPQGATYCSKKGYMSEVA